MLLKELKSEIGTKNLFDFIDYFNEISDTTPYYTEFIIKYGNRPILEVIEEINTLEGLSGIGSIFTLKSEEWKQNKIINDKIKDLSLEDRKIITTNEDLGNIKKNRTNEENKHNTENVVPYDSEDELKSGANTGTNSYNDNETLEDKRTGIKETVYTGYNRDRLYYLERFKDMPDYRNIIYNDIIDILCLQIY